MHPLITKIISLSKKQKRQARNTALVIGIIGTVLILILALG